MSTPTSHHTSRSARRGGRASRHGRGFTLLELLAVVIIIGILAAIAVPGAANRFRENRSQRAANEIATLYRNARMRAMGRGSAVLVRWNAGAETFQVLEAIQGPDPTPACASQPVAQCRAPATRWQVPGTVNQLLGTFSAQALGELTTTVTLGGAEVDELDICFSPMGAAFMAESDVGANAALLQPMGAIPVVRVSRDSGVGLTRQILFLPNGTSRVIAEDPDV